MYSYGQFQGTLCERAVTTKGRDHKCPIHSKQEDDADDLLRLERHPILKVFYHPDSKFVFASDKEKIVKGTIDNDGIQLSFDQELCDNYGFATELPQDGSNLLAYRLSNLTDGPLYTPCGGGSINNGTFVGSDQPI